MFDVLKLKYYKELYAELKIVGCMRFYGVKSLNGHVAPRN